MEFYSLVAAEFQRKDLSMWVCSDEPMPQHREIDLGSGVKPIGYYVQRPEGLFPAPLPASTKSLADVMERFQVLGTFIAKSLQVRIYHSNAMT